MLGGIEAIEVHKLGQMVLPINSEMFSAAQNAARQCYRNQKMMQYTLADRPAPTEEEECGQRSLGYRTTTSKRDRVSP